VTFPSSDTAATAGSTDPAQWAREAHAGLARTVNICPDFGTDLERNWTQTIERRHLEACAESGFTAVRLLVYLCAHHTPNGLESGMLRHLEKIVDEATGLGLSVVISNHRDPQLLSDPQAHLASTVALVTYLSEVFEGRGAELVLEPLSEPEQGLDPIWNDVATELISAVRGREERRTLLLGPRTMNNARFLGELSLPAAERNLIVGIHHYWPITFTMQGEMFLGEDHIFGNPRTGSARLGNRPRPRRPNSERDSNKSPPGKRRPDLPCSSANSVVRVMPT
jgi:endoglucanase